MSAGFVLLDEGAAFPSLGSSTPIFKGSSAGAVPHAAPSWTVKRPDDLLIAGAHSC